MPGADRIVVQKEHPGDRLSAHPIVQQQQGIGPPKLAAVPPSAAENASHLLLGSAGRALRIEALRHAPPQALEFSLQELRLPDGRDPGACAVWCPASHLVAAPRRFVRLLHMTTRSWAPGR
jgi:hypothetical protein